ncbi:MAG: hypothetical protein HFJ80_04730 [Clostridiales bacterium]|nr:hypothetical protein [Clostridiales bacterium]
MNLLKFEKFKKECNQHLPKVVDEILSTGKHKNQCAIGLITTDDFYGFYVTWNFGDDIDTGEYFEWEPDDISANTDFLYQPLVDIVDSCKDIDFCSPSKEKWDFAVSLLTVLQEVIKQLPDDIFHKNNFKREDILFFATMGDGDYIYEMLDTSAKMFNSQEALETFGVM